MLAIQNHSPHRRYYLLGAIIITIGIITGIGLTVRAMFQEPSDVDATYRTLKSSNALKSNGQSSTSPTPVTPTPTPSPSKTPDTAASQTKKTTSPTPVKASSSPAPTATVTPTPSTPATPPVEDPGTTDPPITDPGTGG